MNDVSLLNKLRMKQLKMPESIILEAWRIQEKGKEDSELVMLAPCAALHSPFGWISLGNVKPILAVEAVLVPIVFLPTILFLKLG